MLSLIIRGARPLATQVRRQAWVARATTTTLRQVQFAIRSLILRRVLQESKSLSGIRGKLFTLAYDGSFCTPSGLVVATVDFSYHMYGANMGTLSLVSDAGVAVWNLSGDQDNSWQSASVNLFSASFHFYVRELVEEHRITVPFVASADNLADFFTKPLSARVFFPMRDRIMNIMR
jgi:hypothetical protein